VKRIAFLGLCCVAVLLAGCPQPADQQERVAAVGLPAGTYTGDLIATMTIDGPAGRGTELQRQRQTVTIGESGYPMLSGDVPAYVGALWSESVGELIFNSRLASLNASPGAVTMTSAVLGNLYGVAVSGTNETTISAAGEDRVDYYSRLLLGSIGLESPVQIAVTWEGTLER